MSQHLKALTAAGLVRADPQGARRVYAVDAAGLTALHRWIDGRWQRVLDSFAQAARREGATMSATTSPITSPTTFAIPPVRKACTVPLPPDAAFDLFTSRAGEWWPTGTHSISHDPGATVRVEGRVGGRVLEITPDGQEYAWGHVLAWNPGRRFVLSWYPVVAPEAASRLEVTFRSVDGGTEVALEHSAWEESGDSGTRLREAYETGWDVVLGRFLEAVS